jgi:hypothetical protein
MAALCYWDLRMACLLTLSIKRMHACMSKQNPDGWRKTKEEEEEDREDTSSVIMPESRHCG